MSLVMGSRLYALNGKDDSLIEKMVQEPLDNLSLFGWGRFILGQLDKERSSHHTTYSSVFAIGRREKKLLCGMVERILEGVFLRMFDDPYIECAEVTCSAQGAPCCIFKMECRL